MWARHSEEFNLVEFSHLSYPVDVRDQWERRTWQASFVHDYTVISSQTLFQGYCYRLKTDGVEMPDGKVHQREYLEHQGAVTVAAIDDHNRVAMVRQYRHAAGQHLWELPAGIRDVDGEPNLLTAQRELAEEVDLHAERWDFLGSFFTTPGISSESMFFYLARDLSQVPESDRYQRQEEEAELELNFLDLDEAVAMVEKGEISNAVCAMGLMLAHRHLATH